MSGYVDRKLILASPKGKKREIQPITLHNTTQTEIPIFSLIIMNIFCKQDILLSNARVMTIITQR